VPIRRLLRDTLCFHLAIEHFSSKSLEQLCVDIRGYYQIFNFCFGHRNIEPGSSYRAVVWCYSASASMIDFFLVAGRRAGCIAKRCEVLAVSLSSTRAAHKFLRGVFSGSFDSFVTLAASYKVEHFRTV
jgi:hypothetical protein